MISLLVTPEELAAAEVRVEGDAYRHLFRARRLAAGDPVRLADGAGRARWAEVAEVGRRDAVLRTGEAAPAPEPAVRVHLLVAAPKKERASWLVEKATELGVASVHLLETERTPRGFGEGTVRRLERVATAAFEQCGRGRLPALSGTHPWSEVPVLLDAAGKAESRDGTGVERGEAEPEAGRDGGRGVAGDPGAPGGTAPGGPVPAPEAAAGRWYLDLDPEAVGGRTLAAARVGAAFLLVGPEGGWTDGERDDLRRWGCLPVRLGPTVLRVETAALAGAALLLADGAGTGRRTG